MANLKGITIEIGGDTTKLDKALKSLDAPINKTSRELKEVEKALKLDPKNTVLLAQKQQILADKVNGTKEKLEKLKKAKDDAEKSGKVDKNSEEYRKLEREIVKTTQELKNAEKETKNLSNGFKNVVESGKNIGEKVGPALKGIGTAVAGVVATIGAMTKAFADGITQVADYGDNVDKMSQKIGMSAKSYQEWDYIMQINGADVDMLETSMKKLSTSAQSGSKAFTELGMSQEFVKSASQEELFEATITKLQGMEEGTKRTALASELLGKSAMELGPLLNSESGSVQELKDRAEKYGMVMSDDCVKASAKFKDSLTDLQGTFTGLKNRMIGEFLPAVTDITDGLALVFTGDTSGVEQMQEGLNSIISSVAEGLPKILAVATPIVEQLCTSILENLPQLSQTAVQLIVELGTFLIENLPMLIDACVQIVLALAQGIADALPDLIPTIIDVVITITENLIDNVDLLIDGAIALILGLAEGLMNAMPRLVAKIPELVIKIVKAIITNAPKLLKAGAELIGMLLKGIVNSVISYAKSWAKIGLDVVKGIWQGISNGFNWIKTKLTEWVGNVKDFIKKLFGIQSPSKWARDEVGAMISQGVAVGIEKESDEVVNAFKNMLSELDNQKKFGLITEDDYYTKLEALRDKYLHKGTDAWLEYTEKIFSYQETLASNTSKSMEEALKTAKTSIEKAYNDFISLEQTKFKTIQDQRDKFAETLGDYGGLYSTDAVVGYDYNWTSETTLTVSERKGLALNDLKGQTAKIKQYADNLKKVKAKAEIPADFFVILRSMSVDEGIEFTNLLLSDNTDLKTYINDWSEQQTVAQGLANEIYASDYSTLSSEITDDFGGLIRDMGQIGKDAGKDLITSLLETITTMLPQALTEVNALFSGAGLDYRVNIPNTNYVTSTPSESSSQVKGGGSAVVNNYNYGLTEQSAFWVGENTRRTLNQLLTEGALN